MKTLSVVLATFNEERNLARVLESVKDIADEIVIVDGSSTDKTVEIAKKFNARVKITTNKPNFHINKQMAIDLAEKDWILQLDADEPVSFELKEEIKEILKKKNIEYSGYWMPRKNWFLGKFLKKGGQYPDYTLRLYKRGKGRLPQKDVHEQAEVKGKVGYLKNALLHYPYKDLREYLRKWNNYNKFFAEQIREKEKQKSFVGRFFAFFDYLFFKPIWWFLLTFIRHKGFVDLWPGFVFSFFSALRFPASYLKYFGGYNFLFLLLILLSAVIRFWNFPNRWGLSGDDGRDAMIALEALRRRELPLIGSFSSAGPFVFGPLFYWFIMLSYLILPFFVFSPWIFLCLASVLNVLIVIYLGKLLLNNKFALIIGILACLSPQLNIRSLILGQHTFIFTFTSLVILCFVLFCQKKQKVYAFLTGFFLGTAISFHYQAINLLIFFPALFFAGKITSKEKIASFLLMIFGFLIPSLPLLYWDSLQNFANLNNFLDYLLIAQYRLYVPNSWKIFLLTTIPWYWSFIVGRFYVLTLLLIILSAFTFLILLIKKIIKRELVILGFVFFILLFINRFYKGERSEGYLIYFAPFILIFTSLFFYYLFNFRKRYLKILGIVIMLITLIGNSITIRNCYVESTVKYLLKTANELSLKFPNEKFSLYDYKYESYKYSMGLSLLMNFSQMIDASGRPLGIACLETKCPKRLKPVFNGGLVFDLKNSKEDLAKSKKTWVRVNQKDVYDDLIGWSKTHSLKSTFSLKNYIMERISKI